MFISRLPYESPSVTIKVTGLILLCLDRENRTCRIGAHRRAPDHKFKISLYEVENLDSTDTGNRKEVLNFSFLLQEELWIDVGYPAFKGVYMFRNEGKFDRKDSENNLSDSRWIVDFESPDFYDRHLELNSNALFPGIHLNHGLVYTKDLINKNKHFEDVVRKGGDKAPLGLFNIAESIGIDLYPDKTDTNSKVRFKWGEKGTPFFTLDRSKLYEMVIENNPPTDHLDSSVNHFERYFEVFSDLTPQEQLSLDFLPGSKNQAPEHHDPTQPHPEPHTHDREADAGYPLFNSEVSHDIPCMSGVVGVSE